MSRPLLASDGTNQLGVMIEREQAAQALRESEARYRAVTHSANDAIISADAAGIIVGWNRGARTIFGYTDAEVIGQPLTLLMPHQYLDLYRAASSPALSGTSAIASARPRMLSSSVMRSFRARNWRRWGSSWRASPTS